LGETLKFKKTKLAAGGGKTAVDGAEHLADLAAQKGKDTDNNDSDKNEDKRVLYEALALFLSKKAAKH
jgi:hypothetical protein